MMPDSRRISVLIVDDEPFARKYIREMLKDDTDIEVAGEAGNGKKAVRMIKDSNPDLLFLDIQMPEMDGFALLQNLDGLPLPAIVFTTAYEEYAIRAFEYHALDYLLKPFDQARFLAALDHAKQTIRSRGALPDQSVRIADLLIAMGEQKPRYLERLLVKQNGRIVFVKLADVEWIKADDKYIHLHCGRQRYMIRQALHAIRSQLDPDRFVQVNRSIVVNVDQIKELHPMFNGDHEVQMAGGVKFSLSRSHKNELFRVLGKPVG
jgi:two-component system LytT family response regulator